MKTDKRFPFKNRVHSKREFRTLRERFNHPINHTSIRFSDIFKPVISALPKVCAFSAETQPTVRNQAAETGELYDNGEIGKFLTQLFERKKRLWVWKGGFLDAGANIGLKTY